MKIKTVFAPVLLAGLFLFALAQNSTGTTYYVATNGSDSLVGTNWITAKQTIQAAVDLTVANDTVLVSNGVYATGTRTLAGYLTKNRLVITNNISVQSVNGPAVTSIVGYKDAGHTLSAIRCVLIKAGVLSGFTLSNGSSDSYGTIPEDQCGGGVLAYSALISNCIIVSCSTDIRGGGAYGGTLQNCLISQNQSQGTVSGAGIGGGADQSTLINCTVTGNIAYVTGGGMADGTASNCTLSGNQTEGGDGGGAAGCSLYNCLVINNRAVANGGGASLSWLYNCTVCRNNAVGWGGGEEGCYSYNSIITDNHTTSLTYENFDSYYAMNNTCTAPMPPTGSGNTTNDPRFVNAVNNFHLQATSSCIDTGNNSYVQGATDLDGNPRIVNGIVDIGAYEYRAAIVGLSGNLAFGNVTTGAQSQATLAITNSGNIALIVSSVTYPSAEFSGAWSGIVSPGARSNVTVTFKPTAMQAYGGTITINSDATSGNNTISCSGTGVASIVGVSGNLAFGNVTTGAQAQATLTITNSGNKALTVSSISYPSAAFSGAWSGIVSPGARSNVTVTFKPTAMQAYGGTITINSDATSGSNTISCSGTGVASIVGVSGNLAFGNVPTGVQAQATLTITNSGNKALTVSSISYPSAAFSGAWSGIVSPGARSNVTVTFRPAALQGYGGTITVNSDATSGNGTISCAGTGIAVVAGYDAWAAAITNGLTNYSDCATGDGYPNLLKYATGSSATHSDLQARMNGGLTSGLFAMEFNRNTNAIDVTLIAEGANAISNGTTWNGVATNINGSWGSATNVAETGTTNPVTVTVHDTIPANSVPKRFFRLRVMRP